MFGMHFSPIYFQPSTTFFVFYQQSMCLSCSLLKIKESNQKFPQVTLIPITNLGLSVAVCPTLPYDMWNLTISAITNWCSHPFCKWRKVISIWVCNNALKIYFCLPAYILRYYVFVLNILFVHLIIEKKSTPLHDEYSYEYYS